MSRELVIQKRGRGPRKWGFSFARPEPARDDPMLSVSQYAELLASFSYQGVRYSLPNSLQEEIGADFSGLARAAYKANGVVFACMLVRMLLFSEVRFQYRRLVKGRPGDLFGDPSLAVLEQPGEGMTTGDLLSRAIQHADLGGNWFGTTRYGGVTTLQPNWMTIVAGNPEDDASIWDPATTVIGYSYKPGGAGSGEEPIAFLPEEIAHFAPIPDPEARFRGMSWLTPVIRDIMSDKSLTDHKLSFMEHGATPNMVVKTSFEDIAKAMPWIEKFKEQHEGPQNAAKTLFLSAGMDVVPRVGSDLAGIDLKRVQGAGETRIAAASGVPPVIVGLSEGLDAATYSNYALARRRFADMTMRPLWRNMAGSLAQIIQVPAGAELWYDERDIAALKEDQKDAAEIMQRKAAAIGALIINGFEPDSAVAAIAANDETKLVHTGLVSVQLQAPGQQIPSASPNGSGALPTLPKGRFEEIQDAIRAAGRPEGPKPPDSPSIDVSVTLPELHIDVQPPDIHLELPAQEPARTVFDEGAIQVRVDAPEMPAPVVNVTVEPAEVTVEQPQRSKTVDFGDGRVATITEKDD